MLKQDGLAGSRRGHDQAALAFADRRQQIHHSSSKGFLAGFQVDLLVRVDGGQLVEVATLIGFRAVAFDLLDADELGAAAFPGALHGSRQQHAFPKPMLLHQRRGNVRVGLLGDIVSGRTAEESVTLRMKF